MRNPHEGTRKRVLCLCTAGLLRSPTAAWVLSHAPFNYNTRAAGLDPTCSPFPLTLAALEWAEEIVVMENRHLDMLTTTGYLVRPGLPGGWRLEPTQAPIYVLGIPDQYRLREIALESLIRGRYLGLRGEETVRL